MRSKRTGITERRLVDVLTSHFRDTVKVAREVPHYEKRIDLATVCPRSGELWAIEAKTKNWSRALGQAVLNLTGAERSYIAIHDKNAHRVPLAELRELGIGLISVGTAWGEVEVVLEAPPSRYQNRLAIERVRGFVLEKER